MDISCVDIIIGSALSGLATGYAIGFSIGKTRVTYTAELPCNILIKEVHRLSQVHNVAMKPNKVQTRSIGSKVVQVACHKIDHTTKKCNITQQKCILFT